MGDRAGRKPVHVGLGVDRPEVIFVKQRGDRQLADLANRTRVGPPRPETPGQHTRRQAVIAHSDEDETALPIRSTADVEQARAIRQPLRRDRRLDHLGAARPHGLNAAGQIGGHAVEIMCGEDNAAAGARCHEIVKRGAPFDIDELGAEGGGSAEHALSFLLRSVERSALPLRAAGDDNRQAAGHRLGDRQPEALAAVGVGQAVAGGVQPGQLVGVEGLVDILDLRRERDRPQVGDLLLARVAVARSGHCRHLCCLKPVPKCGTRRAARRNRRTGH